MDAYLTAMDSLGEKIIAWVDPTNEFTGYTNVSVQNEKARYRHFPCSNQPIVRSIYSLAQTLGLAIQ